jgi:hypothetical protein
MMLPVLLIMVSGLLDLGRLYYAFVAVTDAAAEGATYAALRPPNTSLPYTCPGSPVCPADNPRSHLCTCSRAQNATHGMVEVTGAQIGIDCPACPEPPSGAAITVTVRYTHTLLTPFVTLIVSGGTLPLEARANETVLFGSLP